MPDNLKLQAEPVTQERFDRMPALLSAWEVKTLSGINDHELAELVREGHIVARRGVVRMGRKRAYSKYTKVSVGRWCGFKV